MLRIGVDIDGVLYQWDKTARYMLREVLPNSPYKDDPKLKQPSTGWNYIEQNVAPEHWKWLWNDGVKLGLFRHGHLYSGSIEAMRAFSKLGDVVLITSRPQSAVNDTLSWAKYQQFEIAGLHIVGCDTPKSSVMPWCHVYIDDKPENCEDLDASTSCRAVILKDQPWNHHYEIPRKSIHSIVRMSSWRDIINFIEELQ